MKSRHMFNSIVSRASVMTLLLLALQPVHAAPQHDQGQIFGTDGVIGLGTSYFSQSITTGIAGQLTAIELQFDRPTLELPALQFSIFQGGNPSHGRALFAELLHLSRGDLDGRDVYAWDLTSAKLFFAEGEVFSFGFQASEEGIRVAASDPPDYLGGELFENGSVRDANLDNDLGFHSYVDPDAIRPVPLPAGVCLLGGALGALTQMRRRRAT